MPQQILLFYLSHIIDNETVLTKGKREIQQRAHAPHAHTFVLHVLFASKGVLLCL